MQKQQQKQGHNRTCQSCHKQTINQLFLTDIANYSQESNNLTMISKYLCKSCRDQISTIRNFVQENGLCFGKQSSLGTLLLKQIGDKNGTDKKNKNKNKDKCMTSQLYLQTLSQQIKRQKLHHCPKLPENALQLLYYSSLSINHAQRHQSIRNLINEIIQIVPIPYQNLNEIVTLVNVLMCFLAEPDVIAVLKEVGEKWVMEGQNWAEQHIGMDNNNELKQNKKQQKRQQETIDDGGNNLWKKLCNGGYIGNIIILIAALLRNWSTFPQSYKKIKQYQNYIKPTQIDQFLPINLPMSPQMPQSSSCPQCQQTRLDHLLSEFRFKNLLSLILATAIKQDTIHREHIQQIEAKFIRQKEEFINKIIKLKDKIEVMETESGEGFGFRRARSFSESYKKNFGKGELDVVQEKSQGTSKTMQIMQMKQKTDTIQTQPQKQPQQSTLLYLHQILSFVPQFQPSLLSADSDPRTITQAIQSSIKSLSSSVQSLNQKNRHLQAESKRLLAILTRKQQRFVPLIHEKDQIIEKYQNALWRMQRGMIVEDPALASRIQNIIEVWKGQFMESLSNATFDFQENTGERQRPNEESTPVKGNTSNKKKNKEKQKEKSRTSKTQAKAKSGDKECVIF